MKKHYLPNGRIQVILNVFSKTHNFEAINEQEVLARLIKIEKESVCV